MVGCRNSIQCEREPGPSYQHYLKTTLQNVLMFYIYDGRCGRCIRLDMCKKGNTCENYTWQVYSYEMCTICNRCDMCALCDMCDITYVVFSASGRHGIWRSQIWNNVIVGQRMSRRCRRMTQSNLSHPPVHGKIPVNIFWDRLVYMII